MSAPASLTQLVRQLLLGEKCTHTIKKYYQKEPYHGENIIFEKIATIA